ncbi:hypothetical protein K438DRAFT_1815027 [Mycena galopus ATCC 62051]|nr:hypothetical protein K438DRAFT_1815027 [Mycena galopus ATCC 62051]
MDGLLIFACAPFSSVLLMNQNAQAGLFSGTLTAFLIETYKSLIPDPNNILLAQISQQLAAYSNETLLVPSTATAIFNPPTSALICNTLWFISLGLSLSCALVATLLEQWARNFIHRADLYSAPVIRARMISFLYYGLKRFNMHTVVEIVPLLLHAAVLFFFGGLVAFLAPINRFIMLLSAGLLGIMVTCYFVITVLPLVYLDCPYHTPLSSALWWFFGRLRVAWNLLRRRLIDSKIVAARFHTIVAAMAIRAMEFTAERVSRDRRALIWTLKSLADENEFEPLVQSIPDLLWGPEGRRYLHDDAVMHLAATPGVHLCARIEDLLLSCDSGLISDDNMIRRQISCFNALWCIASLMDHATSQTAAKAMFDLKPTVNHYAVSTRALTRWHVFCSIQVQVLETLRYIKKCQDSIRTDRVPDLRPALRCIDQLQVQESFFVPYWRIEGLEDAKNNVPVGLRATSLWLERIFYCLQSFRHDTPYLILFDYLEQATDLDRLPYAYDDTRNIFHLPGDRLPSSLVRSRLEWILQEIVNRHLQVLREKPTVHWIDEVFSTLSSFWRVTEDDLGTTPVPRAILQYMAQRNSYAPISRLMLNVDCNTLWCCMITSIAHDSWGTWASLNNSLTALWHLSALTLQSAELASEKKFPEPHILETVLSCAAAVDAPSSSVIALLKATLLNALIRSKNDQPEEGVYHKLALEVFPHDTANDQADETRNEWYNRRDALENGNQEGHIALLAEFLLSCNSHRLPYKARETISLLDLPSVTGLRRINARKSIQLRFANGLRSVLHLDHRNAEILETLANLRVFSILIGGNETTAQAIWLDDPSACKIIQESLTQFLSTSSVSLSAGVTHRLRQIAEAVTDCGGQGQNGNTDDGLTV